MTTSISGRSTGFTSGEQATLGQRVRRVYEYRRILRLLVGRDLKVRYAGTALGYVWTVIEPLAISVVYWFVFTKVLNRHPGFPPFILFLVAGQLPWYWMSGSITGSLSALRGESQMVRSSNVPRELWVLRVILSKGLEFLFSIPVVVIFAAANLKAPTGDIAFLPLAILMTLMILMGFGLILAPAAVLLPDLKSIVRIVMRVLFYLTPILYSVTIVKSRLGGILAEISSWNPLAGIMILYRVTFFPQELDWTYIIHSMIGTVLIFVIGIFAFRRLERPMLKEI